jgi:hypothetical protein
VADRPGRTGLTPRDRPAPELAPQPGAHDLSALLRSWTDAGLDVELTVHGDLDQLPPGIDLTAYRIVQEALTNTFKHAGPARPRCRSWSTRPSSRSRSSTTGGRGRHPPATPGHGLVGMHERVALYGGRVDTGPRAGGGSRRGHPAPGGDDHRDLLPIFDSSDLRGPPRLRRPPPKPTGAA